MTKPWSLRRRLTGRVLGLVIATWLATIALSAVVLNHEMNEMFDQELEALVETTVLFLDSSQDGANPRTLGIQTNDGERVLRILTPGRQPAPQPWSGLSVDGFQDAPGWRILRRSAEGAVIEAAHATSWRREEVGEAASVLLFLALPLSALLLWGLRRIVTDATRPVVNLAGTVAGRGPDDLLPIGAEGLPRELRPLAEAFDAYLARIEQLRRSERDFVANASHELRTPLAALRSRLELSADPDAVASVATVDALTRRVERLLQLARLEAGMGIGRGPADLVRILRLLIDELWPASRSPVHFDDGDLENLTVYADPDALAILLRNLIENAIEHGTGEVRLCLARSGKLIIENPTRKAILHEDRFDRGEGSSGLGLGLSIVKALAESMDVTLAQTVSHDTVRFELLFTVADG
ncbi:MAG: histidine kinase dimerization/phospho-acceptor domain-containing protein [Paracoccaceae bacterium]